MTPIRILVVEDDEAILSGLTLNLRIEGYEPIAERDGTAGLAVALREKPDLMILDISLPGRNGLSVLAELRRAGHSTPVIVLSAHQDEVDKVAGLRLGADDYVTKPFALAELLARVEAVLRRSGRLPVPLAASGPEATNDRFGETSVDRRTRMVSHRGEELRMTHLEFELLLYFLDHPSCVISRETLLREVWDVSSGTPRTVDNFVAQLRAKLEADPENPRHFVTVRGSGYRFDP